MGAPGLQVHFKCGVAAKTFGNAVVGNCAFTVGDHGHFGACTGMPRHGGINGATARKGADTDRGVLATDPAIGQLCHQRLMCQYRARHNHNARGIFVESVHNATAGQALKLWRITQ